MRDDPVVVALVMAARAGDRQAWDDIVERYAPLVWSICRGQGLTRPDADDVGQNVWLKLFQYLSAIRDPAALPGWIARTAYHECLRVRQAADPRRLDPLKDTDLVVDGGFTEIEHQLDQAQRHIAVRDAFRQLRPRCQELLLLLFTENRTPYRRISEELDIKVGSIGPTRERCLEELRRSPVLAALIEAERRGGQR